MVKKTFIVASAVLMVATLAVVPHMASAATHNAEVAAQSGRVIELPVATSGEGHPDSETVVSTAHVPNGEYSVQVVSLNQESVHPGTDMIVRSGNDQVVVEDVESEAFKEATASGTLEVRDGEVSLVVRIGSDGVFSGGMKVVMNEVTPPPIVPETPETPETPEVPVVPEQPEAPEAPKKAMEAPKQIPSTGPGAALSAIVGASALAGASHAYLRSLRRRG